MIDPIILVILVCLGLAAIAFIGSKFKLRGAGIEIDREELARYLSAAEKAKGIPLTAGPDKLPDPILELQVRGVLPRLPIATILWVDDRPLDHRLERRALATLGISIETYTEVGDALNALSTGDYHLLILGISPPSGSEANWRFLKAIRSGDKAIAIACYAAKADSTAKEQANLNGADAVFERPDYLVVWVVNEISRRSRTSTSSPRLQSGV